VNRQNSPVNLGFCIKQIAIEFFSMENGTLGFATNLEIFNNVQK
jgi:hypothetical protein